MDDTEAASVLTSVGKIDETSKLFTQIGNKRIQIISTVYKPLQYHQTNKEPILSTLDSIISVFLVMPCVVGFWRGTWCLMDIRLFDYLTPWTSFVGGFCSCTLLTMAQYMCTNITRENQKGRHWIKTISKRIYTYCFALICIATWRGTWAIIDTYLDIQFNSNGIVLQCSFSIQLVLITVLALVMLVLFKCVFSCIASPFVICLDRSKDTFSIPTRFKTNINERLALFMLDCVFSVFVVGTLVVFAWRGSWALLDIFLFPESAKLSAWASLISGYSIVGTAFLLQPLMVFICERVKGTVRLLIADVFIFFSFVGTVNVWRGLWNLLNLYLIPENLELSCWITHCISITVLILLGCSNSLLVRGVYIDADEPDGKCVVFPCYYLRLLFEQERLKKKSHMLEKQFTSQEEKTNVQKCGAQQLKQPA